MLLGSFQEIPRDSEGNPIPMSKVQSHLNKELGCRFVWCFPMEHFDSAVFNALTVAPNMPMMFCVFDTDEYYRIDRVKHYQDILNDTVSDEALVRCINNELDDFHSEILIDRKIADKCRIFTMLPFQLGDVGHKIHFNELFTFPENVFKSAPAEMDNIVVEELEKIPKLNYESNVTKVPGYIERDDIVNMYLEATNDMHKFDLTMFPFVYHVLKDKWASSVWFKCMNPHFNQVMKLCFQDFVDWANEDCSAEKFDEMIETFKRYLITNEAVLEAYCKHELPQRNDKCPCGSGKKFKKCCGRYF